MQLLFIMRLILFQIKSLSGVAYKVTLIKTHVFYRLLNMKKELSLLGLFLCLSRGLCIDGGFKPAAH